MDIQRLSNIELSFVASPSPCFTSGQFQTPLVQSTVWTCLEPSGCSLAGVPSARQRTLTITPLWVQELLGHGGGVIRFQVFWG